MARDWRNASERELLSALSDQLEAGRPKENGTLNVSENRLLSSNNLYSSNNANIGWYTPVYTSMGVNTYETTFMVGPDGRPQAVTRLEQGTRVAEATAIPESELAWLRRRVREICWVPA